jgi:pyruvate dehydrogenase E2 component (dihydrolipoamide acetyltransferase)
MSALIEVKVPDIGDYKDVPVIEVQVKPGDVVKAEDTLVTLESDKATMDVPSPAAGTVKEVRVKVGDKVAEGTVIVALETASSTASTAEDAKGAENDRSKVPPAAPLPAAIAPPPTVPATAVDIRPTEAEPTTAPQMIHLPSPAEVLAETDGIKPHASPSVRRFARELGVDVGQVKGTGPKGRITQEDVQIHVKSVMGGAGVQTVGGAGQGSQLSIPPWPQVDFAKFGPIEVKPLSRIKKISGPILARNWVMIPAVTYHEEADITELEDFRVRLNTEQNVIKVTMLAFLIKACVKALQEYPELNCSLDGDNLVFKNYWHIGFAADTPNGLMVPVLKDADRKGVLEIAQETAELASRAREGKLSPAEMQGATFTISSVGGIGGTAFSPIVNAPEVAILGVSKSEMKPKWNGKEFAPRLMLPLSLSADHRVVDGALATRFNALLARLLTDFRRVLL